MPELPGSQGDVQPRNPLAGRAFEILRSHPQNVFAVVDAARDPSVVNLLRNTEEPVLCLYDGRSAVELANFAPYLVTLQKGSALLRQLVSKGWGKAWGIYVISQADAEGLKRHFRKFLMVQTEERKTLYFRFYDPRVLKAFLPTCSAEQADRFFGPIHAYLLEDRDGTQMMEFTKSAAGIQSTVVPLGGGRP